MMNTRYALAIGLLLVMFLASATRAQAPTAMTAEQMATQKAFLAKDAVIGELLHRASSCEGAMLDLQALQAQVAKLEALEKPAEKPKN